jgi:hypothetical protein
MYVDISYTWLQTLYDTIFFLNNYRHGTMQSTELVSDKFNVVETSVSKNYAMNSSNIRGNYKRVLHHNLST